MNKSNPREEELMGAVDFVKDLEVKNEKQY